MCLYGHELSMTDVRQSQRTSCGCSRSAACSKEGFLGYKKIKEVYDNKEVLAPTRRVRCDFPWTVRSRAHEGVLASARSTGNHTDAPSGGQDLLVVVHLSSTSGPKRRQTLGSPGHAVICRSCIARPWP